MNGVWRTEHFSNCVRQTACLFTFSNCSCFHWQFLSTMKLLPILAFQVRKLSPLKIHFFKITKKKTKALNYKKQNQEIIGHEHASEQKHVSGMAVPSSGCWGHCNQWEPCNLPGAQCCWSKRGGFESCYQWSCASSRRLFMARLVLPLQDV